MGQKIASLVLLAIVIFPNLSASYKVYWNLPSQICKRFNMSFDYVIKDFGITMNKDDQFRGNEVNILYTPGLYPEIKGYKHNYSMKVPDLSDLEMINGGLPQAGDMLKHLNAFEKSVQKMVPDPKTNGLIIIDMEHFGATWSQNFNDMEIYKIMSRKQVQEKNPTFTTAQVEARAKLEYERGATNFIVKTIQYAKALRPYAKWGYYQYPQCFNRPGAESCSTSTQEDNNQMILLWKRSDALFPSTYLPKEGTVESKALRTRVKVKESKRVFDYAKNTAGVVIPYITYKYYFEEGFISDADLENLISVPKAEGADGVVIWGSSIDFSSEEKCKTFNEYVKKNLGPISKKYIS